MVDNQSMCTCSPERQPHPGLHEKNCGQDVKGGDSAPLLCLVETPQRVLHPAPRLCSGFCYHRKLEGWLLWEAARNLLHVWEKQCQLTPRWTCCWPRLSPSETVEAALRLMSSRIKKKVIAQKKLWPDKSRVRIYERNLLCIISCRRIKSEKYSHSYIMYRQGEKNQWYIMYISNLKTTFFTSTVFNWKQVL